MAGLARAARLIADAAAINPSDLNVLAATAFLLYSEKRYTEAISAFQRLLDENPNAYFAYDQIGVLLTVTGRTEEAIPMLETAIRRDARSPT
jgi:tetratricopeptide (TPR) repeat protein